MKKYTRFAILLLLIFGALMANFITVQAVEPRYTGATSFTNKLEISESGAASCSGKIILRYGYSADLKVELKQDGTTIKTWTSSGSGTVTAGGTKYVMSGHEYVVTATATVYNADNKVVEKPAMDSDVIPY